MSSFIDDIANSAILDIKHSVCDLTAMFKDIRILDSTTNSSTVQVIATFDAAAKSYRAINDYIKTTGEDKVFIKIGFDEDGDNSADIERMMYKYLKKLLFECRTPNIMRYVVGFRCNTFLDFLRSRSTYPKDTEYYADMLQKVEDFVEREEELNLDGNKATITLIELGKGMSFRDLLKSGNVTEGEFKSIIFQVFYTLREFHLNKVRHNDTHLGNVWINIRNDPQRLIYFINDDMYGILETKYVVKLYDFDRAAFTIGSFSNKILKDSYCPRVGMCENENERFDLLILLTDLYHSWGGMYPFITKFVLQTINNPKYLDPENFKFPGRYCEIEPDPTFERCSASATIEEDGIFNIEQLAKFTDYFDSYIKFLAKDGFQDRDIPIRTPAAKTDIPLYTFKTNFYVSSECSLTPIQMANKLLNK